MNMLTQFPCIFTSKYVENSFKHTPFHGHYFKDTLHSCTRRPVMLCAATFKQYILLLVHLQTCIKNIVRTKMMNYILLAKFFCQHFSGGPLIWNIQTVPRIRFSIDGKEFGIVCWECWSFRIFRNVRSGGVVFKFIWNNIRKKKCIQRASKHVF